MRKEELKQKTVFELATRLNEIMVEQNDLELEYNFIIRELCERIPSLKEDENLQPIVRKLK